MFSSSSSPPLPQLTESSRQQENEPLIETALGAVVDGQQQNDTDLKFGKQFGEQNNNPEDKALMGKEECLYDNSTSLYRSCSKKKQKYHSKEGEGKGWGRQRNCESIVIVFLIVQLNTLA